MVALGADNIDKLIGEQEIPEEIGFLKAWDPVTQQLKWEKVLPNVWNGGVLATAGGLIFFGTATGKFLALDAADGAELLRLDVGTGIIASPITYSANGVQYVAVMAGWGGPAFAALAGNEALLEYENAGRILAFKLEGTEVPLPAKIAPRGSIPEQAELTNDENVLENGRILYVRFCGSCHGMYGSEPMLPDLRRMLPHTHELFDSIVLDGLYESRGMASFAEELDEKEVFSIHAYINHLANTTRKAN